jgi:UDP-N-acetyl-2-amino-2-deoxyglucuronate dehydrogenase
MTHIGILGGGGISDTHARAALAIPQVRIAAVCGGNAAKVQELARKYDATAYGDIAAFLKHRPMDVVAIGSPSGLHGEQAEAVAAAGLHVLIEKPLEITVLRADAIIHAVERAGVKLSVCFQDRENPRLGLVKRWIDAGFLGAPLLVSARVKWYRPPEYYAQSRWRGTWALDGGGALMNQGIHTVDLLVWFLGEPVEVFAYTDLLAHERIEVEDTAVATVRFAGGALGVIHGTTAAYPGLSTRVQVHGTRGSAVIEKDKLVYFHAAGEDAVDSPYGAKVANQVDEVLATAPPEPVTTHSTQFADFLDAIESGRPPLVTAEAATRTLAVIRGIYASAAAGRPVKIKELTG